MLTTDFVDRLAAQNELEPASLVLRPLDGGRAAPVSIAPDRYLYPASMIKTPLAMAVCKAVHDGRLSFQTRVGVDESNMTANDKPSPLAPAYEATVEELLDLMITRSDNVATNIFYDVIGRENATGICRRDFGLRATAFYRKLSGSLPLIADPKWDGVHRNEHSAADAARAFELIARDQVPFARDLYELLLRQEWNNKLSAGLLAGDVFAHKTGDTDEVTHDGGILLTPDGARYVVVVYTGMESNEENNGKFAPFMRALRGYL